MIAFDAIQWDPEMPAEVRAAVGPVLESRWAILPPWLREVRVEFSDLGEASAQANVSYPYRWFRLEIGAAWLVGDPATRQRELAHELCHVILAPIQEFVEDLLDHVGDAGHQSMLRATWTDALEAATTDLGWALDGSGPP